MTLTQLTQYFKSPGKRMPPELAAYWSSIRKLAVTAAQKEILHNFRINPTRNNQQKVAAIISGKKTAPALSYDVSKNILPKKGFIFRIYSGSVYKVLNIRGDMAMGNKYLKDLKVKKPAPKQASVKKATKKLPANSGKKVKLFTRATTFRQWELKKAAEVKVTLSREQQNKLKDKQNKSSTADVYADKKLRVVLQPVLNCRVRGKKTYFVPVPELGKPTTLDFSMEGTHLGLVKFTVDVWQGNEPACIIDFSIDVVAGKAAAEKKSRRIEHHTPGRMSRKSNQLRITEWQSGRKSGYDYEVSFEDINVWSDFRSPEINAGTANYIKDLYSQIELLYKNSAGNNRQFNLQLRNFGANLFMKLFPPEMQKLLYSNRDKISTLQIVSTEPFIPWEIVLIRNPDKNKAVSDNDKFFADFGVTRWIKRGAFPLDKLQCRSSKCRFVIPDYQKPELILPKATQEKLLLQKTFKAKQVPANPDAVQQLLKKKGSFDLLHFCCHGEGDNTRILGSRLLLEEVQQQGTGNWQSTYLPELTIEQCGSFSNDGTVQPIVVLNGCQTGILGKKLAGYGGFAKAFIDAGAAVFVGGLWSLEDTAALDFISTFYKSLKKGKTLSQAALDARKNSKAALDATWLSYVVYGNPFAKLK